MTIYQIITMTEIATGISAARLKSRDRSRRVAYARFLAIAEIRRQFKSWTLEEIGKVFNRDHGTVINAIERAAQLTKTDDDFRQMAERITNPRPAPKQL